jgi:FkbM family methyltransferase
MNSKRRLRGALAGGGKAKGAIAGLSRGLRIVLVEHRLPVRCYKWYYNWLHRLGIRIATVRTKNGLTVKGYTHCLYMFQEVWSKRDYDQPGFNFGKGTTVLDIGANQGFFSLYAASRGASVFAFEPCSDNFEMLKWNVARNGLDSSVHAFNQAVTGKKGSIAFFVGVDSSGCILSGTASTYDPNRGGIGVQTRAVQSTTLDSVLDDFQIETCDFLKMDCEGAEYGILANTSQKSFDRIARISLEAHYGRCQEAVDSLVKAGFEMIYVTDGEVGLIKARNKGMVS